MIYRICIAAGCEPTRQEIKVVESVARLIVSFICSGVLVEIASPEPGLMVANFTYKHGDEPSLVLILRDNDSRGYQVLRGRGNQELVDSSLDLEEIFARERAHESRVARVYEEIVDERFSLEEWGVPVGGSNDLARSRMFRSRYFGLLGLVWVDAHVPDWHPFNKIELAQADDISLALFYSDNRCKPGSLPSFTIAVETGLPDSVPDCPNEETDTGVGDPSKLQLVVSATSSEHGVATKWVHDDYMASLVNWRCASAAALG